jgi:hypothetical protein
MSYAQRPVASRVLIQGGAVTFFHWEGSLQRRGISSKMKNVLA